MFARAGIPISDIAAVVNPIAEVLDAARRAGMTVIYLTMQFEPDLSDAGAPDAPNFLKHKPLGVGEFVTAPDGRESRTLVKGTWGTEILPELTPEDGDIVVAKHRYSGFFDTELDAILREHGIDSLAFTGCTTSVCVDSTLRDAFYRDYRCLLLSDCPASRSGATSRAPTTRRVCSSSRRCSAGFPIHGRSCKHSNKTRRWPGHRASSSPASSRLAFAHSLSRAQRHAAADAGGGGRR
jgi:nicotinamidase-related amidase